MLTAILRSADDAVDKELDYSRYNLGTKNLWAESAAKQKADSLRPTIDVSALVADGAGKVTVGSVFDIAGKSPTKPASSSAVAGLTKPEANKPIDISAFIDNSGGGVDSSADTGPGPDGNGVASNTETAAADAAFGNSVASAALNGVVGAIASAVTGVTGFGTVAGLVGKALGFGTVSQAVGFAPFGQPISVDEAVDMDVESKDALAITAVAEAVTAPAPTPGVTADDDEAEPGSPPDQSQAVADAVAGLGDIGQDAADAAQSAETSSVADAASSAAAADSGVGVSADNDGNSSSATGTSAGEGDSNDSSDSSSSDSSDSGSGGGEGGSE